jgi:hypothetical protein
VNRTVELFIGSDNQTGLLDMGRIETIVSKRFDGFTIWTAMGHYRGSEENTAVVLVSGDPVSIAHTITDLRVELSQDSIGVIDLPVMTFE